MVKILGTLFMLVFPIINKDLLQPEAKIPQIIFIILGKWHGPVQCSAFGVNYILFLLLNTGVSCTFCFTITFIDFPSPCHTEIFWSFSS